MLYTGVTNNLIRRVYEHIYEHKNHLASGFTHKYNVTKLVYYEIQEGTLAAIEREKQLKGGSRQQKIDLIESINPDWEDLYDSIT